MERFTLVVRAVAGAAYRIAEPFPHEPPEPAANDKPRAEPGAK
jgi:hypothetical protein